MKAVITVTGKDTVGIIASVSAFCAEHKANIWKSRKVCCLNILL